MRTQGIIMTANNSSQDSRFAPVVEAELFKHSGVKKHLHGEDAHQHKI